MNVKFFFFIGLIMVLTCPAVSKVKPGSFYKTLPIAVAQQRFSQDPVANTLLDVIGSFFRSSHLKIADPVLIVDATARDPIAVLAKDTVYLTPVRVMSVAIAAQAGPVHVDETPLYITHSEIDQALAALVENRLFDLPDELVLLRHIVAGIAPDGFLPTDLVAIETIASCAKDVGPMADLILRNATSPNNPDYALTLKNPAFFEALPECLKRSL